MPIKAHALPKTSTLSEPAQYSVAITPSDTDDLADVCRAIYVGVAGDITLTLAQDADGVSVLFKAVPVGILPVSAKRVWSGGTAATNMVALR